MTPRPSCLDCGIAIDPRAKRCRTCSARDVSTRPEIVASRTRILNDPENRRNNRIACDTATWRERQSAAQIAKSLSHIPADYRPLYRDLRRKHLPASERLAIVNAQIERDQRGAVA